MSLWRDYVLASIMRDWDDPRCGLGFTFGRCWWGISKGSIVERGIAWRVADSLALRRFLLIGLDERTPGPLDDLADAAVDRHRHAS